VKKLQKIQKQIGNTGIDVLKVIKCELCKKGNDLTEKGSGTKI
jgi:hypothetical protein